MNRITGRIHYPAVTVVAPKPAEPPPPPPAPSPRPAAKAAPVAKSPKPRLRRPVSEKLVLALLTKAAAEGRACPTNREIADYLQADSVGHPAKIVAVLEKAGSITVQRFHCARIVTITATGDSTAAPRNPLPHWRDKLPGARA